MKVPDFNKEHVSNLATQIKKNTDPDVIRVLAKQHSKQLQEITQSIAKEQAAIAAKILPMLKLPSPTPGSILGWVNKTVTGFAMPQLEAQVGLVKQLSEAASSVSEITSALNEIQKYIKEAQDLADSVKAELNGVIGDALGPINELVREADNVIGDTLSVIGDVQTLVNNVTGGTTQFDLSSPSAFLASADTTLQTFQTEAAAVLNAEPPVVDSAPFITGNSVVGQALSANSGTWLGTGPFGYRFQWYRNDEPIPGANSVAYSLTTNDFDQIVKCLVTTTNKADEVESFSNVLGPIQDIPRNTQVPQLSSPVAKVSTAISTSNGEWTGTAPITFQYQWLSNDTEIVGANSSSFTPNSTFVNKTLKCVVIATNPVGSANSTSQPAFVIS